MILRLFALTLLLLNSAICSAAPAAPLPLLSPIFADHMVVQRDKPNRFWGWAKPGEKVHLSLGDQAASTQAGADGRWETPLTPPHTTQACTLVVSTGTARSEISDILVGEVWLCSGQSNMDFALANAENGAAEVAAANHPEIRFFKSPQRPRYSATPLPEGSWQVCTPDSVRAARLSAVAYYFARQIQAEVGVPVGILQAAVGGSPAEAWMSDEALRPLGDFAPHLTELDRLRQTHAPAYGNFVSHWYDRYDLGSRDNAWAQPDLDTSAWRPAPVPGAFAALGLEKSPAVIWLRREITLPATLPAGQARLLLGSIEKMDTAYLNGQWIGASAWVENPRSYNIPAAALKPGRNLLALRVFKVVSTDGFLSPANALQLELGDGTRVPLAGDAWQAAVSVDARPPHPLPLGFENWPVMPTVLYRGMLEPLAPLSFRGVLWYQGEANASRAHQYRTLLPALIQDWRRLFRQGDSPFYIVGLPAFQAKSDQPKDEDWAELREAQTLTVRNVPNTGLAVVIDSGEAHDIHPKDKRIVGERLALLALTDLYGKHAPGRGPEFARAEFGKSYARIHLSGTKDGLCIREGKRSGFALAGPDRKWVWADAIIEGETVLLTALTVPRPIAARYAWQANPDPSVFNNAGLPLAPFRTDDWPGKTEPKAAAEAIKR